VQVFSPGVAVTVYLVIADPPFEIGAVHDTVDFADSNDVASTPVGAPGTVDTSAAADAVDAAEAPDAFVADTLNV
jgi:hypothetical protein